jgi:folate-dependent phosphoribosylglycinamide formyltransferase PurN
VLLHDIAAFGRAPAKRPAFDAGTRDLLAPHAPDLIVLSGYLHIVTAPLLAAFPGRIINVHDADLTLTGPDGRPRYPGLHATRDALRAGETTTRCTAHLVTADVDQGPVLARSRAFPVDGRHHYLQRELMMREAWGPLIARSIQLLARSVNRRGEASREGVEENRTAVGA